MSCVLGIGWLAGLDTATSCTYPPVSNTIAVRLDKYPCIEPPSRYNENLAASVLQNAVYLECPVVQHAANRYDVFDLYNNMV
ncbi:hypothetical protein DFJ58DRAFT_780810, partial [Suillus subalutaceus]|uniref:uncharacterized protein n=1 Tax=Suillus subalutaceus TaxID=48586 RepID=UPI001B86970C